MKNADLNSTTSLDLSNEEILKDYTTAFQSRVASLTGRKEVLAGKAKFGIFGDGKEVAQIAMARAFKKGDWRSGYYRDQTWTDGDCDCGWLNCDSIPASYCAGASFCGCNQDETCIGPDVQGQCAPLGQHGECCSDGQLCGFGLECRPAGEGSYCLQPLSNGCWADSDCGNTNKICQGANLAPCPGGSGGSFPLPGTCVVPGACCSSDTDCGATSRCTDLGECAPYEPALGSCWDALDCEPSQACEGAFICACDSDCSEPDTPGTCVGPSQGCCTGTGQCGAGTYCVTETSPATCAPQLADGTCWADEGCGSGEICHGAVLCACDADCDYEAPGVCVPANAGACTPLQVSWVKEYCDAASIVIFDGTQCIETCPGCCECSTFCDLTFQSLETCQAACGG